MKQSTALQNPHSQAFQGSLHHLQANINRELLSFIHQKENVPVNTLKRNSSGLVRRPDQQSQTLISKQLQDAILKELRSNLGLPPKMDVTQTDDEVCEKSYESILCRTPLLRLHCHTCKAMTELVMYQQCQERQGLTQYGNCQDCGSFISRETNSQAIKQINFRVDIPMDEALTKMLERQNIGKIFNPAASYVKKRRVIVDWM